MSENRGRSASEFELTTSKERALGELGRWWEGKLVVRGTELSELPSVKTLVTDRGFGRGFYTLLTHHTVNETSKEGILALGGVLYVPDTQQTLFYGEDAGRQLQASLGMKGVGHVPYGAVKDGKTFVYLHPIPSELNEDAKIYEAGPNGYSLARAFNTTNPPDYRTSKFNLEQVLQAPWETPDYWLSQPEGVDLISRHMPDLARIIQRDPRYIYQVRMTENKNLIAIV
ncbi:hypothetical protein KBD69_05255 [Candidatus Woesebacteria bacterium]|nr:hypothetical protein [Candidatus Woesebacteria bacterium]